MTTKRIDQEILEKCPVYLSTAIRMGTALLPKHHRKAWSSLWALQKNIESIVFGQLDPTVKAQKSLWWIQEFERFKTSNAKHPLTQNLQDQLPDFILNNEELTSCLDGWVEILSQYSTQSLQWINQAELSRFSVNLRGNAEILQSEVLLGYQTKHQMKEFTLAASESKFRIDLLRDFGSLLRQTILPIPLSDLNAEEILSNDFLKIRSESDLVRWLELANSQATIAEEKAQKSKQWLEHLPKKEQESQWLPLALLNVELKLLKQIKAHQFAIIRQRIELTPRTSAWTIIKTRLF